MRKWVRGMKMGNGDENIWFGEWGMEKWGTGDRVMGIGECGWKNGEERWGWGSGGWGMEMG